MNIVFQLPSETCDEIDRLCLVGDQHVEAEEFSSALLAYWLAWDLLPSPKEQWEAAKWILSSIGNVHFLSKSFAAGRHSLFLAMRCYGALGEPFIHLRLGQCQFELGNYDCSLGELMCAYMSEGADIFGKDDPKYLAFLKTRVKDVQSPAKAS
jgi:hypothetical protein